MSRISIPFSVSDISALARSLRDQLAGCDGKPGHVELLNMLARSSGHRNFQSFRAQIAARGRLDDRPPAPLDYVQVERLARYFDRRGRLEVWPAKSSQQATCLWVVWSKLPPRQSMTEDELNRFIRAQHLFGDHALLRRELCDQSLVSRTADGRTYRRVERQPSAEALALIRHLAAHGASEADAYGPSNRGGKR